MSVFVCLFFNVYIDPMMGVDPEKGRRERKRGRRENEKGEGEERQSGTEKWRGAR